MTGGSKEEIYNTTFESYQTNGDFKTRWYFCLQCRWEVTTQSHFSDLKTLKYKRGDSRTTVLYSVLFHFCVEPAPLCLSQTWCTDLKSGLTKKKFSCEHLWLKTKSKVKTMIYKRVLLICSHFHSSFYCKLSDMSEYKTNFLVTNISLFFSMTCPYMIC